MKINLPTAAAFLAILTPDGPAAAQRGPESLTVRTGDLDLARPGDRARLDARLKRAARMVCHSHTIDAPVEVADEGRCRRAVLAEARALMAPRIAAATSGSTLALGNR